MGNVDKYFELMAKRDGDFRDLANYALGMIDAIVNDSIGNDAKKVQNVRDVLTAFHKLID